MLVDANARATEIGMGDGSLWKNTYGREARIVGATIFIKDRVLDESIAIESRAGMIFLIENCCGPITKFCPGRKVAIRVVLVWLRH